MITLILLFSVLVIFLFSGIMNYKKIKNENDFFFGSVKLTWWGFSVNTFTTNFSFISAVFVLTFWSYSYGFSTSWAIGTGILGIILFVIPNFTPINDDFINSKETLHHFIGGDNPKLRKLAGSVTIITLSGYLIAETYIFSGFISKFLPISIFWVLAIIVIVATFNAVLGGYNSVVKTDTFQFLLIAIGAILLVYKFFIIKDSLGVSVENTLSDVKQFDQIPPFYIPMLVVLNGLSQFSTMDMWQRAKATGNLTTIRKGAVIGSIFFLLVGISILLIGIILRISDNTKGVSPEQNPFSLIGRLIDIQNSPISSYGLVLFYISIFLTTLDSIFLALNHSLVFDIINKNRTLSYSRRIIVFVGATTLIICAILSSTDFSNKIINFLIGVFSCSVILVPSIFIRMRFKLIKDWVYSLSIISGLLVSIIICVTTTFFIQSDVLSFSTPIIALGISGIVILVAGPLGLKK